MVEITEKLIDDVSKKFVQDYIDGKKIEKYFNEKFDNAEYYYQENSVEIFLSDDDMSDYFDDDDCFFKHEYLSNLVDDIIKEKLNTEIDGEKTSWIIDRLLEQNIEIYRKSEMI